ncbi:MAG: SDR family oxidoreductase [Pseudomonadota bacterium]
MQKTTLLTLARRLIVIAAIAISSTTAVYADGHAGAAAEGGTVLITGANRGLGLEFAKQYKDAGWTVIGTARSPGRAYELNALDVEVLQLDVTDSASIDAMVTALDGRSVDLLINNAGIFPRVGNIDEVSIDDYSRTLTVNTVGPMRITQALMPNLRSSEQKKIVNITSQLASIELNTGGNFYGYRESKAALNMFTRTLAQELGPEGFICLTLHPGWVRTDMGGEQAPLSPEQSVTGMRTVIDNMTSDDNGVYRGHHGDIVPW